MQYREIADLFENLAVAVRCDAASLEEIHDRLLREAVPSRSGGELSDEAADKVSKCVESCSTWAGQLAAELRRFDEVLVKNGCLARRVADALSEPV